MKKKWAFTVTKKMILTLLICIGINIIGRLLAEGLHLPYWMDCIGTGISACLGGPVAGGICGLGTNLCLGFFGYNIIYCITNLGLGIVIGLCARSGYLDEFFGVLCTSMMAGIVSVILSIPLNVMFYGGYTGNVWGDGLVDLLDAYHFPKLVCSVFGQGFVDIPDKVITLVAIYGVMRLIKKYDKRMSNIDAREKNE